VRVRPTLPGRSIDRGDERDLPYVPEGTLKEDRTFVRPMAVTADRVPETREPLDGSGGWMELRKVQVTGKATYVVSLPKKWVRDSQLRGGDTVLLRSTPDGSLLVESLAESSRRRNHTLTIQVEESGPQEVVRQFLGAYLSGSRFIQITSKGRMSNELRRQLRRLPQTVIGLHAVDETDTSVSLQVLADTSDYSPARGIRRMNAIVGDMCQTALERLNRRDTEDLEDLASQVDEINKIQWLITKQCNLMLSDPGYADRVGLTPAEALSYVLVARSLARIGFHASRIAEYAPAIPRSTHYKEGAIPEREALTGILEGVVTAFLQGDIEEPGRQIEKAGILAQNLENARQQAVGVSDDLESAVSLAYVIDSLERMVAYCIDVAEIAINHHFALKLARDGEGSG
jgi:phosphate uptake regulator